MRLSVPIFVFLVLVFSTASILGQGNRSAKSGLTSDGRLDQPFLKKAYIDGDFDLLISIIEPYLRSQELRSSREERIFAYKYLSVVYAAEASTRSKAESYMFQLLQLAPNIELVDLYASEKVEALFSQVKKDFQARQDYSSRFDEYGNSISVTESDRDASKPAPAEHREKSPSRRRSKWIWLAASGGAVAAGAVVAVLLFQNKGGEQGGEETKVTLPE